MSFDKNAKQMLLNEVANEIICCKQIYKQLMAQNINVKDNIDSVEATALTKFLIETSTPDGDIESLKNNIKHNPNNNFVKGIRYITDDNNCVITTKNVLPSQLSPVRNTTLSAAEEILLHNNLKINVYMNTANFYFSKYIYNKNKPNKTQESIFDDSRVKEVYTLVVDIDNFPVHMYNEAEAVEKIFQAYPLLKKLNPGYIVDSGSKGFHVYFLFTENIVHNKKLIKAILSTLIRILGADKTKTGRSTFIRVPFTYNPKTGNKCRIIYNNSEHNVRYHSLDSFYNTILSSINTSAIIRDELNNKTIGEYIYTGNTVSENEMNCATDIATYLSCNTNNETEYKEMVKNIKTSYFADITNSDGSKSIVCLNDIYKPIIDTTILSKNKDCVHRLLNSQSYKIKKSKLPEIKFEEEKSTSWKQNCWNMYNVIKQTVSMNPDQEGNRNNFVYYAAKIIWQMPWKTKQSLSHEEAVKYYAVQINNMFVTPLPEKQVVNIAKNVCKHDYKVSLYEMMQMLPIPQYVIENSSLHFELLRDTKESTLKARRRHYYKNSEKHKKACDKKAAKQNALVEMYTLLRSENSVSNKVVNKLAQSMNVCRRTIKNWLTALMSMLHFNRKNDSKTKYALHIFDLIKSFYRQEIYSFESLENKNKQKYMLKNLLIA